MKIGYNLDAQLPRDGRGDKAYEVDRLQRACVQENRFGVEIDGREIHVVYTNILNWANMTAGTDSR